MRLSFVSSEMSSQSRSKRKRVSLIIPFILSLLNLFKVKERPDVGVYVKDLSAYVVNNADDMDKTMNLGNKNS